MRIINIAFGAVFLLLSGVMPISGADQPAAPAAAPDRDAGTWKTWLISSGKDFRAPPPDRGSTGKEVVEVAKLAAARDKAALDKIAY